MKYWVHIKGYRFKIGFSNDFTGMINVHPFKYIKKLNDENKAKRGYDQIYTELKLISWKELLQGEWDNYPEFRTVVGEIE